MENTVVKLLIKILVVALAYGPTYSFSEDDSGLEGLFDAMMKEQASDESQSQAASEVPVASDKESNELDSLFGEVFGQKAVSEKPKPRSATSEMDSMFGEVFGQQSGGNNKYDQPGYIGQPVNDAEVEAVGNVMLQQMFIQLDDAEGVIDRESLLSGEREANLLGDLLSSMEEGQGSEPGEGLGNLLDDSSNAADLSGLNMLDIMSSTLAIVPADEENIFEPIPASYGFSDQVNERRGRYGFSAIYQNVTGYGENLIVAGNINYILSGDFYATLEGQYSLTQLSNPELVKGNASVNKNASFSGFNGGLEYSVARGLAGFSKDSYTPWELSVKSVVGQQYTSGSEGLYLGIGSSLVFHLSDYWMSGDIRYVYVDDEVLNLYKQFRGLQAGFSIGLYY